MAQPHKKYSHLISLAITDKTLSNVVSDVLTAEEHGNHELLFSSQCPAMAKKTAGFQDTMKRYRSKTFADVYKAKISDGHNIKKSIKAERRLHWSFSMLHRWPVTRN